MNVRIPNNIGLAIGESFVDIIGVTVGSAEHFVAMNRFLTDNAIHPIVDRVYSFEEVPEAFAHLRTGSHFGKVVVKL